VEEFRHLCSVVFLLLPVSSKPGTCVKVLTIEPTGNCRLQEDLALLADCALPAELRVGSIYTTSGLCGAVVCVQSHSLHLNLVLACLLVLQMLESLLLLGNAVKLFNKTVSAGPFPWIFPPAGFLVNKTCSWWGFPH